MAQLAVSSLVAVPWQPRSALPEVLDQLALQPGEIHLPEVQELTLTLSVLDLEAVEVVILQARQTESCLLWVLPAPLEVQTSTKGRQKL